MIKLDEISNLGAARIRIRSLLAAVADRERRAHVPQNPGPMPEQPQEPVYSEKQAYTILAPQLSPIHFQFLEAGFQKAGYQLIIAPMPDKQARAKKGRKPTSQNGCVCGSMAKRGAKCANEVASLATVGEWELDLSRADQAWRRTLA